MSNDKVPVPAQDVQVLKSYKPLFDLGQIVATPAVLAHLEKHAVYPAALLSQHQQGNWGDVDPEDAKANDQAVMSGARILTFVTVAYVVISIITESSDSEGRRASTCLLFAEEY